MKLESITRREHAKYAWEMNRLKTTFYYPLVNARDLANLFTYFVLNNGFKVKF